MTEEPQCADHGHTFSEFGFVCTDKGQHRRYPLLRAMVRPESDDLMPLAEYTSFRPAGRESTFGASDYDEFYCAGCGRNTRVMHQKLMATIRGLQEAGTSELDISLLPTHPARVREALSEASRLISSDTQRRYRRSAWAIADAIDTAIDNALAAAEAEKKALTDATVDRRKELDRINKLDTSLHPLQNRWQSLHSSLTALPGPETTGP